MRTLPVLLLALCLAGCSEPAGTGSPLPEFPAEKSAADFPGMSYPSHSGELPRPGTLNGPVWLVVVDGATWELIEPMVARGELPHFEALMNEGAHGVLLSEEPMISPALWATIATGVPRHEHGVVNFLVKLPGRHAVTEAGPPDRRSPAVWELVGAAGGRSTVVSWFGSYPAEEIPGHYVSKELDPEEPLPGQVHPASAAALLGRDARARLRGEDLEAIARSDFLREALLDDARSLAVFETLVLHDPPDFAALGLFGIDIVQHVTWRHMDPASQQFPEDGPPDARLAGVIQAYYRFVDHALGRIRELAPPGTVLLLASDHGGGPTGLAEAFHLQLEVLLEAMGLMRDGAGAAYAIGELYRHEKRIWLNVRGEESQGGLPPDLAVAEAEAIRTRLEGLRTDEGDPVFASIVNHATQKGWLPEEPALSVRFSSRALLATEVIDGGRRIDFSPVRMRHADVSGSHRPEGLLLLHGPGIRPGRLARPASLYRIAPTLLYLLGLPQDRRMLRHAPAEGGILEEAIDPDLWRRFPPSMVADYPGTDRSGLLRSRSDPAQDPAVEPVLRDSLERLRSLGYIR